MRRILVFITLISLIAMHSAIGETEPFPLWMNYVQMKNWSSLYESVFDDKSEPKREELLHQILEQSPDSWLAYAELSFLESDRSVFCDYLKMEDARLEHQKKSEDYERKALELLGDTSLSSIQLSNMPPSLKGFACTRYALLKGGIMDIKSACFIALDYCFSPEEEDTPLTLLLGAYFGDGTPRRTVWTQSKALYDDETVHIICNRVLNCAEELLYKDLDPIAKANIFQNMIDANAYLAYSAFWREDWDELEAKIKKSNEILEKHYDYGDVTNGIEENNRVPACEMYDAHMRALYHAHIGDREALARDAKDFDSAYEAAKKRPPLTFESRAMSEMRNSMIALLESCK